jgi:hypothetical protein
MTAALRTLPVQTSDAELGMTWWNRLTRFERIEWMRRAGNTGVAADAWEAFKRENAQPLQDREGAKP